MRSSRLATGAAVWVLALGLGACGADTASPAIHARSSTSGAIFAGTFAARTAHPAAESLQGHWRSGHDELILVPRADPAGAVGVFGAIASGPREGALWLSRFAGGEWHGTHIAVPTGVRTDVRLARARADQSITVTQAGAVRVFELAGPLNRALLSDIAIYGHRAAGLGRPARENTLSAIGDSWLLGCSGVELDVTVPFIAGTRPAPSDLRVHHPAEWRAELTGFDSTERSRLASKPRLSDALSAAAAAGLAGVYLDPKLKWLMPHHRDAAADAVSTMLQDAAATPQLSIVIGAETSGPGESADLLAAAREARRFPAHVGWALEITRGTDFRTAAGRVNAASSSPDALSWNLLALSGGGGGVLRWFVRTVPDRLEVTLASAGLPLVLWTASPDQFEAALTGMRRLRRNGGRAAIMTAYPHRLAFFLATRR